MITDKGSVNVTRVANVRTRTGSCLMLAGMFAIILLALALRAYRIDGQSLWYDEGVSAAMAPRDIVDITIRSGADIHPPLYYYLLHFWSQLTGTSELALRWLSLIFGVLTVPLAYLLGRRLFNMQVGFFAALFAAISPFLVYYSQEARMYSQVAFLAALSFYLFARLIEQVTAHRPAVTTAAAYVVVSSAMLYSHYFAFTVLVAQNAVALVVIVRFAWKSRERPELLSADGGGNLPLCNPSRILASWVIVQLVTVGTYVPWLIFTIDQLQSWPSISEGFGLDTLLRRVFLVFSFGLSADAAATPNREDVFYALLFFACLLPLAKYSRKYSGTILVLLHLMTPVLVLYALSLRRPMYNPKFLLLAVPAYCLILAVGLESLRQVGVRATAMVRKPVGKHVAAVWSFGVVILFVAAVVYPSAKSLSAYYVDPKYARDDYRGLVHFITARIGLTDAIVLDAPGQEEIFRYYYKGEPPVYPLPRQRPLDEADTIAQLSSIAERHSQIWLVLWATAESDPQNVVERWLDEHSFKVDNRWFGNIRLCRYSSSGGESSQEKVSVAFENGLQLSDIQYGSRLLEPGESLNLTLTWRASKKIDERYTVFVHVLDDRELIWGQMDSEPGGGSKPTNTWIENSPVEDRRGVPVLPGTPPGEYRLELGLYSPASGKRLAVVDENGRPIGDRYLFGLIKVVAPKLPERPDSLGIERPLSVSFVNNIKLVGFALHPLGRDADGPMFTPNDVAHLTLFWQSVGATGDDVSVRIEVRDRGGGAVVQEIQPILGAKYPPSEWHAGELLRDQYKIPLGGLTPGEYEVLLAQVGGSGNTIAAESSDAVVENGAVRLGQISVR